MTVNVINIIIGLLLVASVILPSVLAWASAGAPRSERAAAPPESAAPARGIRRRLGRTKGETP